MRANFVIWKIILGAILVIVSVSNIRMYLGGSTQENAALATSIVVIIVGFYLVYRGFYPNSD